MHSIVIAGGGTGGHVFPAIAIAQTIKELEASCELTFIGTRRGLESKLVPEAGFAIEYVEVAGVKGKSLTGKMTALFKLPQAVLRCMAILRRKRVSAVIGVGGYASAPAILAAFLLRIPVALCEQNSIPGLTNRWCARFARVIFGTFPNRGTLFPERKFVFSGNPLRPGFERCQQENQRIKGRIVVIGGSQGATFLNELVPEALKQLSSKKIAFSVIHQSGVKEVELVKERYQQANVTAEVLPFISNMLEHFLQADVVICRSGATTCSELMALGLPSIMVPFPNAADDHQTYNARFLSDIGGAYLLPQKTGTPEELCKMLETLLIDERARAKMAQQAFSLAKKNAAEIVAEAALKGF